MKTTVELPASLWNEVKVVAREEHTSIKSLIESALRALLARRQQADAFVLRDASVGGNGLRPEFRHASWERMRDTIYGVPS